MSRMFFLSVLGLALACAGLARGDNGSASAPPPLEARLGKTITLIERGGAPERAVIVQVWRLSDGRPVMQAHSLKSGLALTIIENEQAQTADERFAIKRWSPDGQPPADCPLPPPDALRIPAGTVVKTEPVAAPAVKPAMTAPTAAPAVVPAAAQNPTPAAPAPTAPSTLTKPSGTAGGLMPPVAPAPAPEVKPAVVAPAKPVAAPVQPAAAETQPSVKQVMPVSKPVMKVQPKSEPVVVKQPVKQEPIVEKPVVVTQQEPKVAMAPAPAKPVTMPPVKQVQATTPMPAPAPQAAAPVHPAGRNVITVTEDGKARACVVLKEVKQRDGSVTLHVQACDTGECFTVNCGKQCTTESCSSCTTCAPCKPSFMERLFGTKKECAPCVKAEGTPVEAPKVVEAPKPAPKPVVVEAPKPAPKPMVVEAPRPVKVAAKPCPAPCDPCTAAKPCGACNSCKTRVVRDRGTRDREVCGGAPVVMMQVPVPGLPMSTLGPCPNVLPPQPAIPVFNPQLSRSMMQSCKPCCPPSAQPQSPCSPQMMVRVMSGMENVYDIETAQMMKTQVFLLYTLKTSNSMANRQWAAEQLALLPPTPYIADALVQAAQTDSAPLVRMASMRSLAQMRINTAKALAALQAGTTDADPRVREAAAESLRHVQTPATETAVQQTGFAAPK